ncbi:threonine aldolase family protein [Rhodopila sp.]|jgi:threonine aldolase|uniref:threonine aldolase family protein n=1 Tax=Rhodopila sp. TaxID=2480087 RepID=UPI002C3597F4|nr:GntG family PLP-dependent aldolase [Rhodopila sp.]HVZ08846.1 GntG family PLP-dependent aldolase [Rhodopila sp.]
MTFAPPRLDRSLPPVRVNLFSDTQTRPSAAMKDAMMRAEVGDEQNGDDPTIQALCDRMAALLGKEAAMFLPTGTMCNQIAILTHCRPGDEILAHESAHIIANEGGGPAALAGAVVNGLRGARGMFDSAAVTAALREKRRNAPPQTLLAVEQTSNAGGGSVWPLAMLSDVLETGHANGLATHMDGARLMNAVVAAGVPAAEMVQGCDSVWLDFTKGLGAPLGAVLCGSAPFIDAAWRWKQRLGGSLRQGGICAAACLYALDHNIGRLAEDHANARVLAEGLGGIAGLAVEAPETNLVFFDTRGTGLTADELAARLRRHGVSISVVGRHRMRACTHLDVNAADIRQALEIVAEAVR